MSILDKALQSVQTSRYSFCKFLSANDTKATKSHQAGYLVSKSSWRMFLDREPVIGDNIKENIIIKWQDDFETQSVFTFYGAKKNEFRLTRFGRNFPFREEDNVGDLFILCLEERGYFRAYILSSDDDIEDFFASTNISSVETNSIIPKQSEISAQSKLSNCFLTIVRTLGMKFPTTLDLANQARNCYLNSFRITKSHIMKNPDREILRWLDSEYELFKIIENEVYKEILQSNFSNVEDLVQTANSILNRRKSRAGKSLEHHLEEVFKTFNLMFETQAIIEGNKKPDFLFPNSSAYKDINFSSDKLIFLASKTTCKDRWRQILNEADRIKTKHLFTLQQGISKNQLGEMKKYGVRLVVPRPYISSFPDEYKSEIFSLDSFIKEVALTQSKRI